jgi:hypothetical protein
MPDALLSLARHSYVQRPAKVTEETAPEEQLRATLVAAALSAQDVPFVVLAGYGEGKSSAPELQHAPLRRR